MEEDSARVLRYMASNGLIANPKKTAMIFPNAKNKEPISLFYTRYSLFNRH